MAEETFASFQTTCESEEAWIRLCFVWAFTFVRSRRSHWTLNAQDNVDLITRLSSSSSDSQLQLDEYGRTTPEGLDGGFSGDFSNPRSNHIVIDIATLSLAQ